MNLTNALFVPADRPDRFDKAAASGADAAILDLEDAVAPASKSAARANLRRLGDTATIVRINAIGTEWHDEDVASVEALRPDAVMIPKCEAGEEIEALLSRLSVPVIALVETASGIAGVRALARYAGIARLAFGSVDCCADLDCAHTRDVLLPARSELVLSSRFAGLEAPLDGVTLDIADGSVALSDARYARALGFGGKLAIHPGQIAALREGFRPDDVEIDWARSVLDSGNGATALNGIMVDEPVRVRARRILARVHDGKDI